MCVVLVHLWHVVCVLYGRFVHVNGLFGHVMCAVWPFCM